MIQMSRMGLSSRQVDRIHVILRQKASTPLGVQRTSGETVQRGTGAGMAGMGGPGGSGEDRTGTTSPAVAARQGAQTAPGGTGAGSLTKQRTTAGGMAVQRNSVDDGEGGTNVEESRGGGGGDGGESGGRRLSDGVGDDHSHTLKIKAAQALFRMSLEPGGEVTGNIERQCVKKISKSNICTCARCTPVRYFGRGYCFLVFTYLKSSHDLNIEKSNKVNGFSSAMK